MIGLDDSMSCASKFKSGTQSIRKNPNIRKDFTSSKFMDSTHENISPKKDDFDELELNNSDLDLLDLDSPQKSAKNHSPVKSSQKSSK
jgi:hypothetical protein